MQNEIVKCNFHLYLGKKDYEILSWKNSLPPKCFKFYVEQILLSHINGYEIMMPQVSINVAQFKSTPIHIVIENEQIIDFLSKIDIGQKSKIIKEILLFYIREARHNIYVSSNKKGKKQNNPMPSVFVKAKKKISPPTTVVVETKTNNVEKVITSPKTNNPPNNDNLPIKSKIDDNIIKSPIVENKELPAKSNSNPMLRALFKMSGDE